MSTAPTPLQFAVRGLLLHPAQLGLYFYVTAPNECNKKAPHSKTDATTPTKEELELRQSTKKPAVFCARRAGIVQAAFYKKKSPKRRFS